MSDGDGRRKFDVCTSFADGEGSAVVAEQTRELGRNI